MSTLEVACARCDKRFRVRSEFAGKSTRCPGCSAPMVIGTTSRPAPPREELSERPKPRRRDDDDEEPRGPTANWKPVDTALGREQVAVVFVLLIYLSILMSIFFMASMGPYGPDVVVRVIMALLMVGPALVAGVFGLAARVSALRAPSECYSKGATVSSLLAAFAGLASLVMAGLCILMAIDQHRPPELAMRVSMIGLAVATLFAMATFVGFITQVGMARKSAEVARAVGRTAVTSCVCLLVMMVIAFLYALVIEFDGSNSGYGPYGNYRYANDDEPFYMVMVGILTPLTLAVLLISYHRLLAAARRSIRGETEGRYDG